MHPPYPLCRFNVAAEADGVKLIGLNPTLGSSAALPLKLATLDPKKLPIPDPIPPIVVRISVIWTG